jgi:parallel beta-helix repeat protein
VISHGFENSVNQMGRVHNLNALISYETIQEAIDGANPGDTLIISAGIYREKVVINKAISLIGENKENTVLNGSSSGDGFRVISNNVKIKNFTIMNFEHGIYIDKSQNVSIEDMNMLGNYYGVRALYSRQIQIRRCFMLGSHGVVLDRSNQSSIENNFFKGYGAASSGGDGVFLEGASFNTIGENVMTFLRISLYMVDSDSNVVRNNILNGSNYGIQIRSSTDNTFYRNNIFDNRLYAVYFIYNKTNSWDYGNEGNYWGDYEKRYPNAKELDYTGTWDTPYFLNQNNTDNHPLMIPTKPLTRTYSPYGLQIKIYSNSSTSSFNFDTSQKQLSFKATVPARKMGFCNISIPSNLLWGEFSLYLDGYRLEKNVNYTEAYVDTCFVFYITYNEGTHAIKIVGTEAIPESFPLNILLLLLFILLILTLYKRKILKK